MINKFKIEEQKNITNFLNEAHDESQFRHRYNKVLGRKNNIIMEQIYDEATNEYILKGLEEISKRSYNTSFKNNIEKNLIDILKSSAADIENVFFVEADIKHAIKPQTKMQDRGSH